MTTPQQAAANAKKLAEARVLTAVSSGNMEMLKKQVSAVAASSAQAELKVQSVMQRMGPTVEVRRKKKKNGNGKKIRSMTFTSLAIIALMFLINLSDAAPPLRMTVQEYMDTKDQKSDQILAIVTETRNKMRLITGTTSNTDRRLTDLQFKVRKLSVASEQTPTMIQDAILDAKRAITEVLTQKTDRVDLNTAIDNLKTDIFTKIDNLLRDNQRYVDASVAFNKEIFGQLNATIGVLQDNAVKADKAIRRELIEEIDQLNEVIKDSLKPLQNKGNEINRIISRMEKNINTANQKLGQHNAAHTAMSNLIKENMNAIKTYFDKINIQLDNIESNVVEMHDRVRRQTNMTDEEREVKNLIGTSADNFRVCTNVRIQSESSLIETELRQKFTDKLATWDWSNCRKSIHNHKKVLDCMGNTGTLYNDLMANYNRMYSTCVNFKTCMDAIEHNKHMLKLLTNTKVTNQVVTKDNCQDILEDLQVTYKQIRNRGVDASVEITAQGHNQCEESPNWKENGWLAGYNGSCVTGLDGVTWKTRGCSAVTGKCLNVETYHCTLGSGNINYKNGQLLTNSYKEIGHKKCCSLMCHKHEELYESFTNQPMCTTCIKPFTPVFWTDTCLDNIGLAPIKSIQIFQTKTIFEVETGKVTCYNAWSFKLCCAGKGPAAYYHPDTIVDKYCVCDVKPPTLWNMLMAKMNAMRMFAMNLQHLILAFTILTIFLVNRPCGIACLVLYCAWAVVSVEGACSVENLVSADSTTHPTGESSLQYRVKVRPGQCLSIGDATIEIVSIEVYHLYNFLRVVPYFIKPVCQIFDWGCLGGKSDSIYDDESDCYKNCIPGLRKTWKDSEADWIGDKCFFNGRVPTRTDICLSYGDVNSFVDLYTRISGLPQARLTVKFHGIGFESVGHIRTSNIGQDDPISIFEVQTAPTMWPEMISKRYGKFLCAYHYVESSGTCNSGDIYKPMDIDPDCLEFQKKWDTEHGGYRMTFAKKDFETQMHNHFVNCPAQSQVTDNATTIEYHESLSWVEFNTIGRDFKFAKNIPKCGDLDMWTIKSKPGLTYYHRRTVISYQNRGSTCKILVDIDNCISTNGRLIVLGKTDNVHNIEYWCGGNATGLAHITLDNNVVETKELKVLNNFLPHKNTIRNAFDKVVYGGAVGDWGNWFNNLFSSIDFNAIVGKISNWFKWLVNFSWMQLIVGGVLAFGAYSCFVRGNMTGTVLCLSLIWLLCFTKIVLAAEVKSQRLVPQVVDVLTTCIYHYVQKLFMFEIDVAGLVAAIVNYIASVAVWWYIVFGEFSVLTIETRVRWFSFLTTAIVCWCASPWFVLFAIILWYGREIADRCTCSGLQNRNYQYNSLLTSWMTWYNTSTTKKESNETNDPFAYDDTPHKIFDARKAELYGLIKCGAPTDIILPLEVAKYTRVHLSCPNGHLYWSNVNTKVSIATIAHCYRDVPSNKEEKICYQGDVEMLLERFKSKMTAKPTKGDSGMIDERKAMFVGYLKTDNGDVQITTKLMEEVEFKWRFAKENEEPTFNIVEGDLYKVVVNRRQCSKGINQVDSTSDFCKFDGINHYGSTIIGNKYQVGEKMLKGVVDEFDASGRKLKMTPRGVELDDGTQLEHINQHITVEFSEGALNTANLMPDETEVVYDFRKQLYHITPRGLVNRVINAGHVVGGRGYEVCSDLRIDNRNSPLYAGLKNRMCLCTSFFDKETKKMERLDIMVDDEVWWPSQNIGPHVINVRLQKSKIFQCDKELTSGTLIYTYRNSSCFFGHFVPISCITKSFVRDGKRYYVVSRPCDERHQIPMADGDIETDEKWTCSEINENATVQGWALKKFRDCYNLELYNRDAHSTHLLTQSFGMFPTTLQEHSPRLEDDPNYASLQCMQAYVKSAFGCNTPITLEENLMKDIIWYISATDGHNNLTRLTALNFAIKNYAKLWKLKLIAEDNVDHFIPKLLDILAESPHDICHQLQERLDMVEVTFNWHRDVSTGYTGQGKMAYPNIIVEKIGVVKPQSMAAMYVAHVIRDDREKIETRDWYHVTIEGKSQQIRTFVHERLQIYARSGIRWITVHVSGSYYLEEDQNFNEWLVPAFEALSMVLWIRAENPTSLVEHMRKHNVPIVNSGMIRKLLPNSWFDIPHHVKDEQQITNMRNSVMDWRLIAPYNGMDDIDISVRKGEEQQSFAEVKAYNDRFLVGLIANCLGRGSFFICNGVLVSNWHVTRGRPVYLTHLGKTYCFKNPTVADANRDIVMYNGKIDFKPVNIGDIVTAFNYFEKFGVHYSVVASDATVQGRDDVTFHKMVPVKLNDDGTCSTIAMGYEKGMSGSPIVNHLGEPVGVFGLGMRMLNSATNFLPTTVNYSATTSTRVDFIDFFTLCAKNFIDKPLIREQTMYYCNAPTGTGKTTKLPLLIVRYLKEKGMIGKTILILQPNVTAVRNSVTRLHEVGNTMGLTKVAYKMEVGQRNEDHSVTLGEEDDIEFTIMVKTYGKYLANLNYLNQVDYLIFDEVHCISDVDVNTAIIHAETMHIYRNRKILHLSATHLTTQYGYDVAEGVVLDNTPKGIEKIIWTELPSTEKEDLTPTELRLTKNVIKVLPTNATICIDRRYLMDGLVVFFCATQKDCENAASWCMKRNQLAWAYHGGMKQSVYETFKNAPSGWVFATDVIQQSVTLPTLKCVVDFGMEARPNVTVIRRPLMYRCELKKRPISLATQVQRRGRVGRVNKGVYISSGRVHPVVTFEEYVVYEVVLRLIDLKLDVATIFAIDRQLQDAVRSYAWMQPAQFHNSKELREIHEKTGTPGTFYDFDEKLKMLKNVQGDRVKWYLRPYYDWNEIDYYRRVPVAKRPAQNINEFYKAYDKTTIPIRDNEKLRQLEDADFLFVSFKDDYDRSKIQTLMEDDISMNDFQQEQVLDDLSEDRLTEQSFQYIVIGGATCCVAFVLLEKLIDQKTSRWVSHMAECDTSKVPGTAKWLATEYKKDAKHIGIAHNLLVSSFSYIRTMGADGWNRLMSKFGQSPLVEQNDFMAGFEAFQVWIMAQVGQFTSITGISLGSVLGSLGGGGVLGMIWRELEQACGRPLAIILGVTIHAVCAYMLTWPVACVVSISHVAATLARGIISAMKSDAYSISSMSRPGWSGTIWTAIFSAGIGQVFGGLLKQTAARSATKVAAEVGIETLLPLRRTVGHVGVPVLLVKHIYYVLKGESTAGRFAGAASMVSLIFESDPLTLCYAALVGVGVFAAEMLVEKIIDSYAHRDYAGTLGGEYFREKKACLRAMVEYILDTSALVVYPVSFISIVIGVCSHLLKGKEWKNAIDTSFKSYAGVSPIVALFSELWQALITDRTDITEQSISTVLLSMWGGISRFTIRMAQMFKPGFDCIWNAVKTGWHRVINWFKQMTSKMLGKAGNEMAQGAITAVGARIGWFGTFLSKMNDCTAEEYRCIYGSNLGVIHSELFEIAASDGLSSIDKYWLQIGAGSISEMGDIWNNQLVNELKVMVPERGCTFKSERCIEFFQINVHDLNKYTQTTVGNTWVEGDALKAHIGNYKCDVHVDYVNNFNRDEGLSIIRVLNTAWVGVKIYWAIHYKRSGSQTEFQVVEYGPTDGVSKVALATIAALVPTIGCQNPIQSTKQEINHWHKNKIGVPPIGKSIIGMIKDAAKSSFMTCVCKLMTEYAAPPYILDNGVIMSLLNRQQVEREYWNYMRYWCLRIPAMSFSCKPTKEMQYYDPRFNVPYGHKVVWLEKEMTEPPRMNQFEECKNGLKLEGLTHCPWQSPFLVTNNPMLTKHTLYMFALNQCYPVWFEFQDNLGKWTRAICAEGKQCGSHWLHVVFHDGKWFWRLGQCGNCHCDKEILPLHWDEFRRELRNLQRSAKPMFVDDNDCINQTINAKPATKAPQGEHPTLPLGDVMKTWASQLIDQLRGTAVRPEELGVIREAPFTIATIHSVPKEHARSESTSSNDSFASAASSESAISYYEAQQGMLGVDEIQVVEQSSSIWDSMMRFFGFEDDPIPFYGNAPAIDVLNRINYLLTASQQEEYAKRMVDDLDIDQFYDSKDLNLVDVDFIQGFKEPTRGRLPQWNWYTGTKTGVHYVSADTVMSEYQLLSGYGVTHKRWEDLKRKTRFQLPKSIIKLDDQVIQAQSRAFYKMQQIHEADPVFFDNCRVILDPACGYGGFEQYLSMYYKDNTPRIALIGTLVEQQHRLPNVDHVAVEDSNFKVVSMIDPKTDNGNIRDPAVISRYLTNCERVGRADLLILDIGEFKGTSLQQYKWWTSGQEEVTKDAHGFYDANDLLPLVEGMYLMQNSLKPGGKMLLKWTGFFKGGDKLLWRLLSRFEKFRAIKVGTASCFSTEFYIEAAGFKDRVQRTQEYVREFYNQIGERIFQSLSKAKTIWFNPSVFETHTRTDWAMPMKAGMACKIDTLCPERPPGMRYELNIDGTKVELDWDPHWEVRLEKFHKVLRELYGKKNLKFVHGKSGRWNVKHQEGWFQRKTKHARPKRMSNQLLASLTWDTFRMNDKNSVVGRTQNTEEYQAQSRKKRLDIKTPVLTPQVLSELGTIMELMRTEYGKGLKGKCRYLTKEETYRALNKGGATSVLSQFHSLSDFIEKVPGWYELCMEYCVHKWEKGLPTHSFWNIMHKNEPKVKKNVDKGRIVLEKGKPENYSASELDEELESHIDMVHRYIQYGDEISRIAHYIVLGDLIEKGSHQKLYKGTINGTPPFHVGNLLRACWDANVRDDKEKTFVTTHKNGVKIRDQKGCPMEIDILDNEFMTANEQLYLGSHKEDKPAGITLDFSALDGTISVGERMIEANWISYHYPPEMRNTIMNLAREMTFGICIDHEGDLTLRAGERASGEITTSLGNTLVVGSNVFRSVARCLGIPVKALLKTIAVIRYDLGSYVKILELTRVPQFSDGDDTVIMTTMRAAEAIAKGIDEVMSEAGKVIRSGTKSGVTIVDRFWDLEFCSHHYERVLIGPNANYIHIPQQEYLQVVSEYPNLYRLHHLPTRPTSEILGKLRATLKQSAMIWNKMDQSPTGPVMLTRSKLVSYLLMYPHMRYIRYTCITALGITGDGSLELDELVRRYPDLKHLLNKTTFLGALHSVYGVRSLDDIAFRNYVADNHDIRQVTRHAGLIGFNRKMNVRVVVGHLFQWLCKYKEIHPEVFGFDTKFNNMLHTFLELRGSIAMTMVTKFTGAVKALVKKDTIISRACIRIHPMFEF